MLGNKQTSQNLFSRADHWGWTFLQIVHCCNVRSNPRKMLWRIEANRKRRFQCRRTWKQKGLRKQWGCWRMKEREGDLPAIAIHWQRCKRTEWMRETLKSYVIVKKLICHQSFLKNTKTRWEWRCRAPQENTAQLDTVLQTMKNLRAIHFIYLSWAANITVHFMIHFYSKYISDIS